MPAARIQTPGGDVTVVDFWRERPPGSARAVFFRKELPKLRKAGAPTWRAVILVKEVIPGTLVSAHYEAADIRRIMRNRAARANRFSSGGGGGGGKPPFVPRAERDDA